MKQYVSKGGKVQYKPSFKSLEAAARTGVDGFCLACGKKVHGVEPDARKYTCPHCHKDKVYGAEELVIMGLYHY